MNHNSLGEIRDIDQAENSIGFQRNFWSKFHELREDCTALENREERDRGPVVKLDINQTDPSLSSFDHVLLSLSHSHSLTLFWVISRVHPFSSLHSGRPVRHGHVITSPCRRTSGFRRFYLPQAWLPDDPRGKERTKWKRDLRQRGYRLFVNLPKVFVLKYQEWRILRWWS